MGATRLKVVSAVLEVDEGDSKNGLVYAFDNHIVNAQVVKYFSDAVQILQTID